MKNKEIRIAAYILGGLPIIACMFLYSKLPAQVPTNWGIDGQVTYGPRSTFIMIAMISLGLVIMQDILPHIDPRRRNYIKFGIYYDAFCLFMALFMDAVFTIIIIETFRPGTVSMDKVITLLLGLLFIFIGNMMPKVKSNFFMGIRTSWALSDNDVWNKTNRLGGFLMFVLGLFLIVISFIFPPRLKYMVLMVCVAVVTGIPAVMSFIWYQAKHKNDRPEDE